MRERQLSASRAANVVLRRSPAGPIARPAATRLDRVVEGHGSGASSVLRLQRAAGNAAVSGMLACTSTLQRTATAGQCKVDGEELVVQLNGPKSPAVIPAGTAWDRSARVTPTFTVSRPAPTRSDSDPSTTSTDDPTFTGKPAVDAKGKVWRYQLAAVTGTGTIQLVFFDASHYPAPTPTDDSGALTNVTSTNWKDIRKDLRKNRAGVPDFWSAYRAEELHENYHWEVEWQGQVKRHLAKAEKRIARLGVDFVAAPTEADAETALKPQVAAIFKDEMDKARDAYDKLGDSEGDPPFRAQAPALDALRDRVIAHAKANKWR